MSGPEGEAPLPPSGVGTVLLDLGGDIGAVVAYVEAMLDGHEIDLFPLGATAPLMHSAVRRRDLGAGCCYAAVYPSVPAGDYLLGGLGQPLRVVGGAVTEVGRPAGARASA